MADPLHLPIPTSRLSSTAPDEIINEILKICLAVPDSAFASTETRSPFSRMQQSSSALLVVCKCWMRVATPLLYETVILRSTAQAQALAAALKANTDFGRYIKKLRVEGGYGASVEKVIRAAPNITDFCMTLLLWAEDNVKGMCKAMPALNPRRVIVIELNEDFRSNASTRAAFEALRVGFETWPDLRTVVIPGMITRNYPCDMPLIEALKKKRSLQEVILTGDTSYSPQLALNALALNPSVETLRIGCSEARMLRNTNVESKRLSAEASAKLRYAPARQTEHSKRHLFTVPIESLPSDPSYTPMASASQQDRTSIWTSILEFVINRKENPSRHTVALLSSEDESYWSLDTGSEDSDSSEDTFSEDSYTRPPTRSAAVICMLVCKEFKTIAIKVACKNISLRNAGGISSFFDLLSQHPELASEVTSVRFDMRTHVTAHWLQRKVESLLRRLTHVTHVSCFILRYSTEKSAPLDYGALAALSDGSAGSVVRMDTLHVSGSGSIDVLARFSALTHLEWFGKVALSSVASGDVPRFEALQTLVVARDGLGLLSAMAKCELPRLQSLRLCLNEYNEDPLFPRERESLRLFLDAHGERILKFHQDGLGESMSAILSLCPNLTEIITEKPQASNIPSVEAALLVLPKPHTALTRIECPRMYGRPDPDWKTFFSTLNSNDVPALRTIAIHNKHIWPVMQRDIAKSQWPGIAEKLLESGISMVDGEGVAWRPRLRASGTRRK